MGDFGTLSRLRELAFHLGRVVLLVFFAAQIPLGASIALAYDHPGWDFHREAVSVALSGSPSLPADAAPFVTLFAGMLGGTLVAWGIAMVAITRRGLSRREPWAWWTVAASALGWFVLDTSVTVALRADVNLGLNVFAMFWMPAPLALTAPAIFGRATIGPQDAALPDPRL
jgi:hypothetical protein